MKNQGVLFINASENKNGNTSRIGHQLLQNIDYEQINLVEYKIYQLGQSFHDDQFDEIVDKISDFSTIVLGTPVYWHSMSGYLKVFIERLGRLDQPDLLRGKNISVFVQGADPSDTEGPTKAIIKRFAQVTGMNYQEL